VPSETLGPFHSCYPLEGACLFLFVRIVALSPLLLIRACHQRFFLDSYLTQWSCLLIETPMSHHNGRAFLLRLQCPMSLRRPCHLSFRRSIVEGDALFFLQLLLPIGDPKKSGIDDDSRLGYYSKVEQWTQKYATSMGLGGSYGHAFKEVMLEELLHFDSVVIRHGVHGGTYGAIYQRWRQGETTYDKDIAASITHTRWLQLKIIYKVCDNATAPKKSEEGYNPGYKFDYIFKCIINNINELSHSSDLHLCGDETTWAHNGFGEAGTGLLNRVMGKPGVTKSGQIVLVSDAYRNHLKTRHKGPRRHKPKVNPASLSAHRISCFPLRLPSHITVPTPTPQHIQQRNSSQQRNTLLHNPYTRTPL
jgi:hypothetical protein